MRRESDFLGEVDVPANAYYGAQTRRAVRNFPISGLRQAPAFTRAMALLKKAAALVHGKLGALEARVADAIARAADEVIEGRRDDQFVVDVFQAGAGTSAHMNMNEVLANRASELLGGRRGEYALAHPNDHVNMGQSTNDVFPTSMRVAALLELPNLLEALGGLAGALADKAGEFAEIAKSGRTHLQDAVPLTLGQEFGAYAEAVRRAAAHIGQQSEPLRELGIGGSAVGSGLNTLPGYRAKVVERLADLTGLRLVAAPNRFEAMQSMGPFARMSGALRAGAVELGRISNDLRLLSSGPTTGLGEIRLPAVQPGSSIMPGKVNPVVAECMNMICFQVVGNDACISAAAGAGQLELNVMMPVIGHNLLWSMQILTNGARMLAERCVADIEADADRCAAYLAGTVGLATVLNPVIGYHRAAEVARKATETGKTIRQVVLEDGIMSEKELDKLLSRALRHGG
ncbi:MAG: aspartate ammonia-lyase [Candidatus Brocadiia bacterium]|nr:aspartate ammonia-lyase [Candidatus Brocadiia bacterium]